jgi:mannose-6-phosphate isomerase-like protein (cupin superfamily)
LVRIAKALGVSVSVLMEEDEMQTSVMTKADDATNGILPTEKGYHIYAYAAKFGEKKMQPFLFVARKGEVKEHRLSHDGEEFIYVLEGTLKLQVGDIGYTLKPGDSVYFSALEMHGIMPLSDEVKYLDFFV